MSAWVYTSSWRILACKEQEKVLSSFAGKAQGEIRRPSKVVNNAIVVGGLIPVRWWLNLFSCSA